GRRPAHGPVSPVPGGRPGPRAPAPGPRSDSGGASHTPLAESVSVLPPRQRRRRCHPPYLHPLTPPAHATRTSPHPTARPGATAEYHRAQSARAAAPVAIASPPAVGAGPSGHSPAHPPAPGRDGPPSAPLGLAVRRPQPGPQPAGVGGRGPLAP